MIVSHRSTTIHRSERKRLVLRAVWAVVSLLVLSVPSMSEDRANVADEASKLRQEQYRIAEQLNRDFPNDFEALRILGFVHSSHGNQEEMVACWKKCRGLEPKRADIVDQLARHAASNEEHAEAVTLWKEAIQIDQRLRGMRLQMAQSLLSLSEPDQAIAVLDKERTLYPRGEDDQSQAAQKRYALPLAEIEYVLGEAWFQKQEFEKAKEHYRAAVKHVPQHSKAIYGLVKSSTRLKQKEEAAKYMADFQALDRAAIAADAQVRAEHDDLQLMRQRVALTCLEAGVRYARQKQREAAERLWLRSAELDAKQAQSRVLLVGLYRADGNKEQAVKLLQQLTQLEPQRLEYFEQLGFLQVSLGNFPAAEQAFKQMIQTSPKRSDGYRALAKLYLNGNRNVADALPIAESAVKLEPIADSYFVWGWANAKAGKIEVAREALQEAVRMDSKNRMYRQLFEAVQNQP